MQIYLLLTTIIISVVAFPHEELARHRIHVKGKPFNLQNGWPEYHSYCTLAYALLNHDNLHTWFEFGVAAGVSINITAALLPKCQIIGFDSFEGLPTTWRGHYAKGAFTQHGVIPPVRANVRLIKGLFQDTLPLVLPQTGVIDGINIDCDLYEPSLLILNATFPHWRKGTLLHFHEFHDHHHHASEERRALESFVQHHPTACLKQWDIPPCGLDGPAVFTVC